MAMRVNQKCKFFWMSGIKVLASWVGRRKTAATETVAPDMAEHKAIISWQRNGPDFLKGKYSREHTWTFDGGLKLAASASPSVVPLPWSNPSNVDPEEAFVAAISSCHMLTYLYLASVQGFTVDSYCDEAIGFMIKDDKGVPWVSDVTLNPQIVYGGDKVPGPEDVARLHHLAHEQCFIANSVKTRVAVAGS
jgi:organic hydroperoxide reductase OsmC/OhrA